MAEDLADLADLMKELPGIADAFEGSADEMKATIKDSLGKYGEGTKGLFQDINIDENGKQITATDSNGRSWSVSDAVDKYNDGNIKDSFKEILGDKAFEDPKISENVEKLQTAEDNTFRGKAKAEEKNFSETGRDAAKKLPKTADLFKEGAPKPTDADLFEALKSDGVDIKDMKKFADNVDELRKKIKSGELKTVEDVEKEIKRMSEQDPNSGKYWEKLMKALKYIGAAILIAVAAFLSYEFIEFLKLIRDAMNGCWSTTQEGKCKIDVLTCNKDDMKMGKTLVFGDGGKGFTTCDFATDSTGKHSKSGSNLLFIPLLSGNSCSCNLDSKGQPITPLDTSDWNSQGADTDCSGASAKNPKCPVTSSSPQPRSWASATSSTPACKNTSGCITDAGACASTMNSQCSSWCSSKQILTVSGQSISCVDVSIMDVLGNLLQDALPSGFLGMMETILFWAAVAIVGILVLGFIWKEVAYLTEGGGESHGGESHTIYVKTENPAPAEVSFGRRKKRYI